MRDVIRLIEADGWRFERQRGSHRIYRHPEKPGTVTVAGQRGKDLPVGTLENIKGVDLHIASLREHGEAIPKPASTADVIAVAVT